LAASTSARHSDLSRRFEFLLSATQSELQRNPARLALKYAKNARISRLFANKPDWKNGLLDSEGSHCLGFSLKGACAVRFKHGIGECNAITSRDSAHS